MEYFYAGIIALVAVFAGLLAVSIMSRLNFSTTWIRKLSHLGSMTVVIIAAIIFGYKLFIVVGIVFALLLLLVKFIRPPKALKTVEALGSYGEVFFFIGVTLTAFIAESIWQFVIPIAILGLADTAAYVVGRSVHSPKLFYSKTLAGSLAFTVVSFCLLLMIAPWWLALTGAIITALAELVGQRGSDNVTVPLAAVLLLTYL